jgi:hypothetical protein
LVIKLTREGFSFVTLVTVLNRPNTGKEEEDDDDEKSQVQHH